MKRMVIGLSLALLAAGCHGGAGPYSPLTPGVTGGTTQYALGGMVLARSATGRTAVANASVTGWVQEGDRGHFLGAVRTDADGHYAFAEVPAGAVLLSVYSEGYVQRCAAAVDVSGDARLDVEIVSEADVLGGTAPAPLAPPMITGTVYESPAGGSPQPLAGASLFVENSPDFLVAETRTDPHGRYVLCGLPASVRITATKDGFMASTRPVNVTASEMVIDFEVTRPDPPVQR